MAGSGNLLGSKFEEIAQIIEKVENKSRVGVCLDTCHMFAAGYDIRTKEAYEKTILEFDRQVGLSFLRGMHLNDSKTAIASSKDRHENIGQSFILLPAFGFIMRDVRLQGIPSMLETPANEDSSVWEKEIEVLNGLSTTPPEGETGLQKLRNAIKEVAEKAGQGKAKGKKSRAMKKTTATRKRKRETEEEDSSESEERGE